MTGSRAATDADALLERLAGVVAGIGRRVVACSGGVDSLVLATVAHRGAPSGTVVAHAVSPAVPGAATARVVSAADAEGWRLEVVETSEFGDERYLSNPTDRCYWCKSHLYDGLSDLPARLGLRGEWTVVSGANTDDLGEYRPGLRAAAERGARHPYVEAGMAKSDIRAVARRLGLPHADLPASPCLASRLYTGTRVTEARLRAVEAGEAVARDVAGVAVVRCRIRGRTALVEIPGADRPRITPRVLALVSRAMRAADPSIDAVHLDDREYRPGRAVLRVV